MITALLQLVRLVVHGICIDASVLFELDLHIKLLEEACHFPHFPVFHNKCDDYILELENASMALIGVLHSIIRELIKAVVSNREQSVYPMELI